MKSNLSARDLLAAGLAHHGFIDSPSLKHMLMGDVMEIWRRSCHCKEEGCGCWELAKRRDPTEEERTLIALASAPQSPRKSRQQASDVIPGLVEKWLKIPVRPIRTDTVEENLR